MYQRLALDRLCSDNAFKGCGGDALRLQSDDPLGLSVLNPAVWGVTLLPPGHGPSGTAPLKAVSAKAYSHPSWDPVYLVVLVCGALLRLSKSG